MIIHTKREPHFARQVYHKIYSHLSADLEGQLCSELMTQMDRQLRISLRVRFEAHNRRNVQIESILYASLYRK